MVDQLIAIGVVWVYSFVVTAIILKVLDVTMGLRVNEDDEEMGLDVSQHGERGYVFDEGATVPAPQYMKAPPAPSRPRPEPMAGSEA